MELMRYIAFLRAINVGGHVVRMDRLRSLFEALRFRNVETFIASGNVIFETSSSDEAKLTARIEQHLEKTLGYEVRTFLRTDEELQAMATYQPFGRHLLEGPRHGLYVGMLHAPPERGAERKLAALGTKADHFHIAGRELYWLVTTLLSESKISGATLEKAIGVPATLRNVNTIERLARRLANRDA
jgi:uncharacterized protein (DUF1697 family)